jgi:VCBS repeat-containing protein
MSILFTNGDNETDGGALELDGASFVTSADVGGTTYVFVAGGVDNGISVFSLALNGTLTSVANVTDSGLLNLVGVSGLSTVTSDGNTYLIAAGAGDSGLSVFRVSTTGALTSVDNLVDGGSLNLSGVSRVTTATVSGNAYVFAAGTNDDGISVFSVAGDGKLTSVSNLADNGTYELDGVKGLTTAVIGGSTYLFAAGGVDDGVSVFSVAANGILTNTSNVTDNGTLKLDGASDVATAVVGGVTYLFVTGAVDNGVSVFSVDASGVLTNVANVGDTASLRLAGATGISVNTFGTTTYLTVGGTENGLSTFRVNTGGTLTAMENIDDAGSKELAGTTQVHSATVGGTNYVIGAGSTDDGVSVFGLKPSGQLWFTTEGGDADTRIVRINNDGSSQTINIDNTPASDPLPSSFQADVGLDTAAGFYFGLTNSGPGGDNAILVRGAIGSSATPTTVVDFPDTVIVNGMQVDAINHKIYVGYQDGSGSAPANTGIRVYAYNPLTGAVADQGFLVTSATDSRGQESGFDVLDPRDFALDSTIGRLFYTELLTGGVAVNGLFRLDLASPNTTTQLVSQAQFPDDGSNGYIYDVEVDTTTDLVYFTTESNAPSPFAGYDAAQNAIWYISENASSGTAVKVTLVGAVAATFYPGDMTFDQVNRQLYVESEDDGSGSTDDVIYVFQLDGAGTTATLINTFFPNPTFVSSGGNIQGMVFSQLPTLGNLNGTASQPVEQAGAGTVLLTGAPTITDTDGDHLAGATVQITGGKFSSNEASTSDDHLGYGAGLQVSGLISGTNITLSWNAASETLTLDGYDTLANYQLALAAIRFWSTGDNPTNYGLNTSRTITWTLDDGTPDIPAGGVNSGTTTITIADVNDAPVNGVVTSASGLEDAANIAVTGLQIDDPDANPALDTVTVTLSVTKGVLTLLTNVSAGLTSGEISGNGTDTVTISATLNEINATLAAAGGLLFAGDANTNGTDTLTVVTNDGGGNGSGGAQSDTNGYTITITAVNDAPVVAGDGTESLAATNEDVANASLTNTVSALFGGQYDDSADQVTGGSSANAFAGIAVTANDVSGVKGQWQYYTGAAWANIGAASTAAAVTLTASTPLRFLPVANFNGPAPTLTAHLVDNSGGALSNFAHVDVTTTGGSTPYSTGTVVLDHAVTAVNDAPVTVGGAAVTLTTILEDAGNPAGQTISALFASHFSDAADQVTGGSTANAFTGVAITANTATAADGTWQYFSGTWQDIPAVATSNAFILAAGTLVRFLPAADFNGAAPALVVYLIDDSAGAVTTGQTADLTTTGGATPYGTALTLSETVTAVNDPHTGGVSITGTATEDQVLTADTSTLADADGLGTLHYDWQHDTGAGFVSIGAADQATYTLTDADVGVPGTVRVVVSYTDDDGTAESATSSATAQVAGVNDAPTGTVTITGTVTENQVLTANTATLADVDGLGALHYQWQHNVGSGYVNIAGAADQATYTLGDGDVGGVVRVVVSYTDLQGFANTVNSNGTASIAGVNDPHTGGVSITGTATEDQVLTADTSTLADVDGLGTLHYQWQHDVGSGFVNIGALDTASTYTLTDADVGVPGTVRVVVSYTDLQGFAESATSAATAQVAGVNDAPTGTVTITGTVTENQVLTANTSALADVDGLGTLHYDWQRNIGSGFVSIGAADQATYTLDDGDVGGTVRVVVSYTDLQGFANTVNSTATASIDGVNDPHTGTVTITGTATEDQVLTAVSTLADIDGVGTLHYQWQHNIGSGYVNIAGAAASTYTLGDDDVGGVVRVVVSYTDQQGFAESATSSGTASITNVNDAPTGTVTVTGTVTENQVLTADTATLADVDGLGPLSYQWQRNAGSGFVNIGALDTASTYTLTDADVGGTVRVVVSYTDQQGTAESKTSAATAAIAGVNDPHTGGVSITGTATENQVLTAVSTLADVDGLGTLHYQWQRDVGSGYANVVGAADQATYTLTDADVGGVVRVVVSYTDGQGFAESATSPSTAAIANVNDAPTGTVTIAGTVAENEVLTADTSTLADADGLGTLHYQWQRDSGSGFVNVGTNQATYTLDDPDVGATIRVVVSYTDDHGTAEAKTSAATAAVANGNDVHTGGVSITGAATEDQVLTAVSTLADPDGLGTLHYDWQRDSGSGFASIGAADQATYTLGDADVGGVVRVVVSYTDGGGFAETATSAATGAVANVNDAPTGAVVITGAVTEDQVLTADTSTLADADGLGTLHYQWQRDSGSGFANVGTDQATYVLGDADVGAAIRVVASYTDGYGAAESKTSAATAAVANVNDGPMGVNDAASVTQRLSTSGTVRANDTDIDNTTATLTVTSVAFNLTHADQAVVSGGTVVNGGYGKLTINPDGTYTYLADQEGLIVGQVVTDKFDYTVSDPGGATATAQLTVTITGSATGDANANILISDGLGHTLTGRGGADILTGNGGADIFAYEAVGDSAVAAYDTITDFAHGVDSLLLTPLMTASTKLTLVTDGTNKFLEIDQNGDGTAEDKILVQGQGLQVTDIVTGVANYGFKIQGSSGADVLTGGTGADLMTGGGGADIFAYAAGDSSFAHWDRVSDFAPGVDKIDVSAADGGNVAIARFGGSSFIYFGNADTGLSVVEVNGDVQADDLIVSGAVTGVTLYGGTDVETLRGGAGKDVLVGGFGNTTLIGGGGTDILYGGPATDTFLYPAIADSNFTAYDLILGFASGTDKIDISAIDGGKVTLARYEGNTFIYTAPDAGGAFQSAIVVAGTTLKSTDLITSGGANQAFVLVGDGASHNVADVLVAAGGNDILYGMDGADTLTGGGGADFLVGGTGADTFVFTATTESSAVASDLVWSFSTAEGDRIDLTGIDANSATAANDAFSLVTAFSNVAGQLVISAADSAGYAHLSGDVNGDGIADFVLALTVATTFTGSDILL